MPAFPSRPHHVGWSMYAGIGHPEVEDHSSVRILLTLPVYGDLDNLGGMPEAEVFTENRPHHDVAWWTRQGERGFWSTAHMARDPEWNRSWFKG